MWGRVRRMGGFYLMMVGVEWERVVGVKVGRWGRGYSLVLDEF